MTEAYDGRQVVGIDLHRRRSVIVRMTEDGRKLETVRITSSPAALRREIARAGQHPQVVVEATYGWYWAADVLEEAGAEVHLAHPLGVKAFTPENSGAIPECYGQSEDERPGGPARRRPHSARKEGQGTRFADEATASDSHLTPIEKTD